MSFNWDRLTYLGYSYSFDLGGRTVPFDKPVKIEIAEVTAVDRVLWTCDVTTVYTKRECRDLDINGIGIDRFGSFFGYMPQVGDRCVVAFMSDELLPRILCFIPWLAPQTGPRGLRKKISPGDMLMSTSRETYVHVAKGGIVDIAADPITRRIYVALTHTIKDFCESHELYTAGGMSVWQNNRPVRGKVGETTRITTYKRKSDGPEQVIEKIGFVNDDIAEDSDLLDQVYGRQVLAEDGTVSSRIYEDTIGNYFEERKGSFDIRGSSTYKVTADDQIELVASNNPTSKVRMIDGKVELAGAESPAVKGDELRTLLSDLLEQLRTLTQSILTNIATVSSSGPGPGATALTTDAGVVLTKLAAVEAKLHRIVAQHTFLS